MLQTSVQSSNIKQVGWEGGKLYVEFHHGGVYVYDDVPLSVYHAVIGAPSVGKAFIAEVKGRYNYAKVCWPQEATTA